MRFLQSPFRQLARIAGVLTIALLLGACSGAYRDPQARTVGDVTDDLAIGAKLKTKLLADQRVSGLRINVDVHQGVVTLRGRVPNSADAEHAVELARQVKGVTQVVNQMRSNP